MQSVLEIACEFLESHGWFVMRSDTSKALIYDKEFGIVTTYMGTIGTRDTILTYGNRAFPLNPYKHWEFDVGDPGSLEALAWRLNEDWNELNRI